MFRNSLILNFIIFALVVQQASARTLPRYGSSGSSNTSAQTISTRATNTVIVSPSFMPGRGGLSVAFNSLNNATSVSYTLSYETNGKAEGVAGSVSPAGGTSATRELLFGTCSTGVCTPHRNITNMKLEIRSQLTSGKTSVKRYKIRP